MRDTAFVLALRAAGVVARTKQPAHYDESKVGTYTLPDALKLQNGDPVGDSQTWYQRRRNEILRLFEENVYGRSPEVTPEKKVVRALRDWDHLGPATAIQILDKKGIAERRELQR